MEISDNGRTATLSSGFGTLLVQPVVIINSENPKKYVFSRGCELPLNGLSLATYLCALAIDAQVLDLRIHSTPWEEPEEAIGSLEPRIVGVTACSCEEIGVSVIASRIKAIDPSIVTVRFRSTHSVYLEISDCIERYGIRDFRFCDDMLTLLEGPIDELCHVIIDNDARIGFNCYSRIDQIFLDRLKLMCRAGCYQRITHENDMNLHHSILPAGIVLQYISTVYRKFYYSPDFFARMLRFLLCSPELLVSEMKRIFRGIATLAWFFVRQSFKLA